jgi:hypothetical protein
MGARTIPPSREPSDTYYEILGVPEDADQGAIRAAYRRLSNQVHPDRGGSSALFRKVVDAYATLSDPARREAYDRFLHGPGDCAPFARTPGDQFQDQGYAGWGEEASAHEGRAHEGTRSDDGGPFAEEHAAPGWVRVDAQSAWGSDHGTTGFEQYEQYPSAGRAQRSGLARYFDRHPAGFVALAGLVVYLLGAALGPPGSGTSENPVGTSVTLVGFLFIFLGLVAMAGGRRLKSRPGPTGLPMARRGSRLLLSELAAGFRSLGRALVVLVGAVFLASLVSGSLRHRHSRDIGRRYY